MSGKRRDTRGIAVEFPILAPEHADTALAALRAHPLGCEAARIGTVVDDPHRFVVMATAFGGQRVVDWLTGEPLPRIC